VFETPSGDPFALGQLNSSPATPRATAPANAAARIAAHIAERKTAH